MSYEHSTALDQIAKALSQLQGQCGGLGKSGENRHLGSRYAMLPDCWEVIRPLLAPLGLAVVQFPIAVDGAAGVLTHVMHESGQWIKGETVLPVSQGKGVTMVQAIGSTTSYAKRYALMAVCGLAEDEHDDDGNAAGNTATKGLHHSARGHLLASPTQAGGVQAGRGDAQPRPAGQPVPDAGELDDMRARILALTPNLPTAGRHCAEQDSRLAYDAGDLKQLSGILARVKAAQ